MAFEHASMSKMKEIAQRAQHRLATIKKASEKGMHQAFAIAEVNGTLFGWGYANARYGALPAGAAAGAMKEIAVMGVPADLGLGVALLGLSLFGGLGMYAEHGINVGNGSTGAFSYRMGTELGEKALSGGTTTPAAGVPRVGAAPQRVGPQGGRMHHVQYER